MDRLAMEFISTFGMPPVEHVELVASLGLRHTGMGPAPIVVLDPGLYPEWSMRGNPVSTRRSNASTLGRVRCGLAPKPRNASRHSSRCR